MPKLGLQMDTLFTSDTAGKLVLLCIFGIQVATHCAAIYCFYLHISNIIYQGVKSYIFSRFFKPHNFLCQTILLSVKVFPVFQY